MHFRVLLHLRLQRWVLRPYGPKEGCGITKQFGGKLRMGSHFVPPSIVTDKPDVMNEARNLFCRSVHGTAGPHQSHGRESESLYNGHCIEITVRTKDAAISQLPRNVSRVNPVDSERDGRRARQPGLRAVETHAIDGGESLPE